MPEKVREVRADYPQSARQRHVQGPVWLKAVVSETGCVQSMEITDRLDPSLDLAALLAQVQWRFKPATRDGRPVPMIVTVQHNFALRYR